MFKMLVLQMLCTLSDNQAEYQLKDRFSFSDGGARARGPGAGRQDHVVVSRAADRAGAVARLFARFGAALGDGGILPWTAKSSARR